MTSAAYLKQLLQEPWRMWLKTEAKGPPASLPCSPGIRCWELRKRKNQTLLVRKERESLIIM